MAGEVATTVEQPPLELPWQGRSLLEAISEVNREINVRVRCYPRWIAEGRKDPVEAQDCLDRLQAARHFLLVYASQVAIA